ncbi:hypothetical protein SDC9_148977 [bioreactor metagenome]|uniref:Uncharacterized protein n=1 Tax=bioreactor metagenome TaxID=1076179 RepID=A0A645EID0_9ZZZZ
MEGFHLFFVEDAELFQHLQRRGFHKEVDALGDGVGFDEAAAFRLGVPAAGVCVALEADIPVHL